MKNRDTLKLLAILGIGWVVLIFAAVVGASIDAGKLGIYIGASFIVISLGLWLLSRVKDRRDAMKKQLKSEANPPKMPLQ